MTWTPIIVAAVASYIIGAIWYGPLFGKLWMKLSGMTKAKMKKDNMPLLYAGGFLVSLVTAFVIAQILSFLNWAPIWQNGVIVGFWVWLGFVATFSFSPVLWQGQKFHLWLLNNVHNLLVILVMGAIIAGW